LTHREKFEKLASDLYDERPVVKGAVLRIFTKHVRSNG
jgi:hypothetical protein